MTTPLPLNTELKSGFQRTYMSIYNAASYSLSAEYTDCRFRKPKHAYGMSASRRVASCLTPRRPSTCSAAYPYMSNFNSFPTRVRVSLHESPGTITAVPPVLPLQFSRTEATLRPAWGPCPHFHPLPFPSVLHRRRGSRPASIGTVSPRRSSLDHRLSWRDVWRTWRRWLEWSEWELIKII
jgi:hypothetical protein